MAAAHEKSRQRRTPQDEIARRAAIEARRLTQDLERRLTECRMQLESATRELEEFAYSVAHDLRAPLRLIHAHAQMLREYRGIAAVQEPMTHVDQIQRGAEEMNALIDGLLGLSRVSRMEMRQEPTALGELLRSVIDSMAPQRNIEWHIDPLPCVACDPELMRLVLACLVDNAAKYSRTRRVASIVVGTAMHDDRHYVFVRDNGVGFDMRYAHKLFGMFQRLHRQDEFEGSGIGLATARRIIERHGGRIWAEAAVDKGAEFRFTLAGL